MFCFLEDLFQTTTELTTSKESVTSTQLPPSTQPSTEPPPSTPTTITTPISTDIPADTPTTEVPTPVTVAPTTEAPTTVTVAPTDPPTTEAPTTVTVAPTDPPTTEAPTPVTAAPTDPPTTEAPTLVTIMTNLTALNGDFSSPNWPNAYPQNVDYQWIIHCPSNHSIEINFKPHPFRIAGHMPECNFDWVQVHEGSSQGKILGKFCHYSAPQTVSTKSNIAVVKFHAGNTHSSYNKGFGASYKCAFQCPSITVPTLPHCGGHLKATSGTINSPNYPVTYNINESCEWIVEIPDCQKAIEIVFKHFSVAGRMPECPKDQLYIDDGISQKAHTHGPLCHLSLPSTIKTTSNVARFRFIAGPKHGPRRTGFSISFRATEK